MDLSKLRQAIADEYRIALFRHYREQDAAKFWDVDISTVKRWRREGRIPFIAMPNGGIKYLGLQIVDVLLLGSRALQGYTDDPSGNEPETSTAWRSTNVGPSNVGSGISASVGTHQLGTEHDTTLPLDEPNVSASAQLTRLLRKND